MTSFTSAPFSAPSTAPAGTTSFTSLGLLVSPAWFNAVNTVIPLCAGVVGNNTFTGVNTFTRLSSVVMDGGLTVSGNANFSNYAGINIGTANLYNVGTTLQLSSGYQFACTSINTTELNCQGTVTLNTTGTSSTTIGNAGGPSSTVVQGPIYINNTPGTGNTNIGYPTNTTNIIGVVDINATGSSPTTIGSNSGGNTVSIGGTVSISGSLNCTAIGTSYFNAINFTSMSGGTITGLSDLTTSGLNVNGNSNLVGTLTVSNTSVLNGTLTVQGGGAIITGGLIVDALTITGNGFRNFNNTTATTLYDRILCFTGSVSTYLTLSASSPIGTTIKIILTNSSPGTLTLLAGSINGTSTSLALSANQYQIFELICVSSGNWVGNVGNVSIT